jgi:hypothetical protein
VESIRAERSLHQQSESIRVQIQIAPRTNGSRREYHRCGFHIAARLVLVLQLSFAESLGSMMTIEVSMQQRASASMSRRQYCRVCS